MMKFNSKHIILCFLMIFSVLLVGVSGVCAQDIHTTDNITDLNNNNDIGKNPIIDDENETLEIQNENNLSATGTFDDLQVEINNAPVGSVLNLNRNYTGTLLFVIQLNKNLTINGHGHTLDCLNKCSGFYSSSGNITLMNLKIINGFSGIYIGDSAQYTIINCTFNNNWVKNNGGAIYNGVNKTLTVINSTFNNNKVDSDNGGAIYSVGDVYLENSIFNSNIANVNGGAIFSDNNAYITNCLFESNNATGAIFSQCKGGAVYCKNYLTVENSTFKNNHAYDYGGAVYAKNINVNNNQDPNQSFNSFFINNGVKDNDGGAIYSTEDANVKNTVFTGNRAYEDGGALFSGNNAYITNCLFESNKATGAKSSQCEGGAVYCKNDLTVENSTFNNNYAYDYGGAVYAKNINVNNKQDSNQSYNSFFKNNGVRDNDGGAIYSTEDANVKNTVFTGNNAYEDGGALFSGNNAYITNCLFESNKADGAKSLRGGDIYCKNDLKYQGGAVYCKNDLTVENSTFKHNYAYDYGGAIYADTLELKPDCIFDNNVAYNNQGGAIWVNKFKKDVILATFINNKAGAKDDGGAIYINKENHITFSNCTFKDNYAGDEGGAIYLDSPSSELTLKNNTFINNHACDEGQDVFNKGTYGTITNNHWGTDSPDFSKDLLVEWKFWKSNVKHKDENPSRI